MSEGRRLGRRGRGEGRDRDDDRRPERPDRPDIEVRPGWPLSLTALAVAGLTAGLISVWAVSIDWLAIRLAIGGLLALAVGLALGSNTIVGLASLPALAGATIGLDRPSGHAWGQVLLVAILWYAATELAWGGIEARSGTRRGPEVIRLRVREVATVIAVSVAVGVAASALAEAAPARTAVVRALAVTAILVSIVALGRHLAGRARPPRTPEPAAGSAGSTGSTN